MAAGFPRLSGAVSPSPAGRPAILSADPAIRRNGVEQSGRSISARIRPATQNRWMCVNKASKPQHRHDLELQLLRAVRHALGQGVQPQEQHAHAEDRNQQKNRHDNHKAIGLSGGSDEARKRMWRGRIDRCGQAGFPRKGGKRPKNGTIYGEFRRLGKQPPPRCCSIFSPEKRCFNLKARCWHRGRRCGRNTPAILKVARPRRCDRFHRAGKRAGISGSP